MLCEDDNGISWQQEAEMIINEVRNSVKDIAVATELESSKNCIFLNLTTLENKQYCVELSALGFRVVGYEYNNITEQHDQWFDTPYSFLSFISEEYRKHFAATLREKLEQIKSTS